MLAYCFLYS